MASRSSTGPVLPLPSMLTQLCTRGQLFKSEGAGIVRIVGITGANVKLSPFSSLPPWLQIKQRGSNFQEGS